MAEYPKPYLPVADQIALLQSRGMTVTDASKARECLTRIGYYRLSAYWFPCRETTNPHDVERFKPDSDLERVVALYVFDKRLRLLMLDVIERIEVSLRTQVALEIGKHHPLAHRVPEFLIKDAQEIVDEEAGITFHQDWLDRLDARAATSKEKFANHFRSKYPDAKMPIWIAVELLDFGPLSLFLSKMKTRDVWNIAETYGVPRPELLIAWIRSLTVVRNTCAHHARLWNKPVIDQPKSPKRGEILELDHMLDGGPQMRKRLYGTAAIARFLLKSINPNSSWPERLKELVSTFPAAPHFDFAASGFPKDWANLPLWQR